ncbi:hypothetical protein ID866_3387 [Astraeus odoratus]|nr:hypothetical protein ID866_3387 [Astraeus odoratus]
MTSLDLTYVSAPMVNQSDAPFRILTRRYGATLAYTQMLDPHKLLDDREYLEFHLRDIKAEEGHGEGLNVVEELGDDGPCLTRRRREAYARPVIVQLCGNDPQVIVKAARQVQPYCDGIGVPSDLNLGCPQEHAREGHFGGYLLGKKDWPLIRSITSAMAHSLLVPTSAKIRLCPSTTPTSATATFGRLLEHAGASWVTLHARHVSSKRRRQGAADLDAIRALKDALSIPVISNGNVRTFDDVRENLQYTGADGAMVGETLLGNPTFVSLVPPVLCKVQRTKSRDDEQAICRGGYTGPCTHLPRVSEHMQAVPGGVIPSDYPNARAALRGVPMVSGFTSDVAISPDN